MKSFVKISLGFITCSFLFYYCWRSYTFTPYNDFVINLPDDSSNIIKSEIDSYADYPFCDAKSGMCYETPDIASPRTVYSAKSREQLEGWWRYTKELNISARDYVMKRRKAENSGNHHQNPPLIFLGDSITEAWLGTSMGNSAGRAKGVPDVLEKYFKKDYDPLILAISGDQTQHLLYRLENGQLLPDYADDPDAIFIIMIGTNNLGDGELPSPTSDGVIAVVDYLMKKTVGRVLLLHLLPRGDDFRVEYLCPPRCDSHGRPFKSFMPAVEKVNTYVSLKADKLGEEYGRDRIDVLDCGGTFTKNKKTKEVDETLMPDKLHPNAYGHQLLANCILECINGDCDSMK